MTSVVDMMQTLGKNARVSAASLRMADTNKKNTALTLAAQRFRDEMTDILAANAKDMQAAEENNLEAALKDRLALDESRV
ncbi:MAG TPA: gamma-glutamyl-phosphate reductase, partial [Mariprofundaceae bacterium]|nr:gamma-glutamyl-phosphate reductase [Mariprofundaceae bacterium]